jgi:phosphohistidine phosphatase SixA
MLRRLLTAVLLLLASAVVLAAEPVVILVRHAERADARDAAGSFSEKDPDLSAAGHARAEGLARLLKDASVTAIFTTALKRTQQTAAPLARTLAIEPTVADAADLLQSIRSAQGAVLIVGHSNTVPDMIARLGVKEPVTIADDEFDNLFVVFSGPQPTLLRLRY